MVLSITICLFFAYDNLGKPWKWTDSSLGKMLEIGQACCEDNIGSWLVENCHLQTRAVIWCGCWSPGHYSSSMLQVFNTGTRWFTMVQNPVAAFAYLMNQFWPFTRFHAEQPQPTTGNRSTSHSHYLFRIFGATKLQTSSDINTDWGQTVNSIANYIYTI